MKPGLSHSSIESPTKRLYCDAAFSWTQVERTTSPQVFGKICVADGNGFVRIEKVGVGRVKGLKQYNNILELVAIGRAIEIAIEKGMTGALDVYTDSMVARSWATGKMNAKVRTVAHTEAEMYVALMERRFIGEIRVVHVLRDSNHAGIALEGDKKNKVW